MRTREELRAFIAALPIPDERRAVVLLELEDHVFERMAELEAAGLAAREAECMAVASLGDLDGLAAVQRAFAPGVRVAWWLGVRVGAAVSVSSVAFLVLTQPGPMVEPPGLPFFAMLAVVLVLAWPWRVATRLEDFDRVRDGEVMSRGDLAGVHFLGGALLAAAAPLFLWAASVAARIPLGRFEGALFLATFGTIFAVFAAPVLLCSRSLKRRMLG